MFRYRFICVLPSANSPTNGADICFPTIPHQTSLQSPYQPVPTSSVIDHATLVASNIQMRQIAIGIVVLILGVYGTAHAQSARQIAQKSFPSVVLLLMEDKNGQVLSQGSGFVIGKGVIATNFHVIEGASAGVAKVVGKKKLFPITGVVAVDKKRDLALLAVGGLNRRALKFADINKASVGDKVYAVGNPLGLEGTFSEGIVSGIRHYKGDTILQITAPISPGSSGGPILNAKGEVIGVAVATFRTGQNLNFAIPIDYVDELSILSAGRAPKPLRQASRHKGSKSLVDQFGSKNRDGVRVTHATLEKPYLGSPIYLNYSIRNTLRQSVKDVKLLFIFYGPDRQPVHVVDRSFKGVIPARLAKRSNVKLSSDVASISFGKDVLSISFGKTGPYDRVLDINRNINFEARVLDFKIVN